MSSKRWKKQRTPEPDLNEIEADIKSRKEIGNMTTERNGDYFFIFRSCSYLKIA